VKKSKIREEDIIKMGISKTGHKYVDWNELFQDRFQWWASVNMVKEFLYQISNYVTNSLHVAESFLRI
jgi:hypothetical protein